MSKMRSGELFGRERPNRKSMNRKRKEVGHPGHHRLMALESGQTAERLGHDDERKVPAAAGRASVPGVRRAVVVEIEGHRLEIRQAGAQRRGDVDQERSGRYRATDATVPTASRKNRIIAPQTLKFTQIAVG